jgi:translation initiation factor 2 subunit 1
MSKKLSLTKLRILSSCSGSLDVKMAPKAVTLREETELQAMLDRLALDQEEVDGDDPEDN